MGNAQNISAWWKNFTVFLTNINNPSVAWKTIAEEVYQLTPEVPATGTIAAIPATYRLNVYPIDRNDPGADLPDVAVGYKLMDYIGQVYEIIAVNETLTQIDVADILLSGYCPPSGRPAMIYNETSQNGTITPPDEFETRWVVVSKTCLLDGEGHNTGQQEVVNKKQQLNEVTNQWEDTGEITKTTVTNHADCPPPAPDPYRAAQFVGLAWNAELAQEIVFTMGVKKKLNTMTAAGNNYLFLSIPTGHSFEVEDGTGIDITEMFVSVGADNQNGFQPNTVWRKNPKYASGAPLKINLTIV